MQPDRHPKIPLLPYDSRQNQPGQNQPRKTPGVDRSGPKLQSTPRRKTIPPALFWTGERTDKMNTSEKDRIHRQENGNRTAPH